MRTTILLLCFAIASVSFASGRRSEQLASKFNQPTPDWLAIGAQISVEPLKDSPAKEPTVFHSRSGGAINTHDKVKIPNRGIEFTVPEGINGVSLNSDGTKLLVNTGTTRLYEILPDGQRRELPFRVPKITYDEPSKWGYKWPIERWSWASNDVLIADVEIPDEKEENTERRLYVFFLKDQVLSRLDLSKLQLGPDDTLGVISVGADLHHMKLKVGQQEVLVKVDLKSSPKIVKPKKGD